jgi:hypothetical protein
LANYIETERILSKGSSLSDLILKRRNRNWLIEIDWMNKVYFDSYANNMSR